MRTLRGRLEGGRIIRLDEPMDAPDGTELEFAIIDRGEWMTDAERAELDAEIEAGDREYERGEFVQASEIVAQVRAERGR